MQSFGTTGTLCWKIAATFGAHMRTMCTMCDVVVLVQNVIHVPRIENFFYKISC